MCSTQLQFCTVGLIVQMVPQPVARETLLWCITNISVVFTHWVGGGSSLYTVAHTGVILNTQFVAQSRSSILIITFWLMPRVFGVQLIKQNLVFLQNEKGLLLELLTGETRGKVACQKASLLLSVIHSLCWRISHNYSHTTDCGDTYMGEPPLEEPLQK